MLLFSPLLVVAKGKNKNGDTLFVSPSKSFFVRETPNGALFLDSSFKKTYLFKPGSIYDSTKYKIANFKISNHIYPILGKDKYGNTLFSAFGFNYCFKGRYKEFYQNGKLKVEGCYDTLKVSCGIKTGAWKYYNDSGQLVNTEFWENGKYVSSTFASNKEGIAEIWNCAIFINGKLIKSGTKVKSNQIKEVDVKLEFKKGNYTEVSCRVEIHSGTRLERKVEVSNYFDCRYIDISKFLKETNCTRLKIILFHERLNTEYIYFVDLIR